VSNTVRIARRIKTDFVVCCGVHSTGGASSIEGGIVIDLRRMNKVTVDENKKPLTVQGRCLWENVDVEATKFSLATVGGKI
jgi:FAD/FMN-containing dehydrogenase